MIFCRTNCLNITMNFSVYEIFVIAICLYHSAANPAVMNNDGRIMGGHDAKPHSHPYMVSLQTRLLYIRMHVCGGVLLNENFILSAAHCATESWLIRWLPLDAVAGAHDINTFKAQTQVIEILHRIPHPLYNSGIGLHDIGLYKTIKPFIFTKLVQPIHLSTGYKYGEGKLKLLGWGALKATIFIPDMPDRLQEVAVTYLPLRECQIAIDKFLEANEVNPLDEEFNICTGPTTGGVAACLGDSGGPLVEMFPSSYDSLGDNTEKNNATLYDCPNNNGTNLNDGVTNENIITRNKKEIKSLETLLLGVVSWGVSPCGEKGAPTVYTNVAKYIDFINYNIKDYN